ncbi:MAG: PKD domain-containing protein, partial [Mariniphaga sp.]|nr:PKD domain-containing protein [Mariniphaga sp.]
MIGCRAAFRRNTSYNIDEIRLWNRALSQEELLENQLKSFTSEEEGLQLYLNFDDTFKDISGNGNDGIPLYLGEFETSNFNPPISKFETYQTLNEVSFNNKSENATSYKWNFGDGNSSEQGNPKNIYSNPGEYTISLTSKNKNSVASVIGHATINGLEKIEPSSGGNLGYVTLNVYGGGLTTENTSIILRKEGEQDIVGEEIFSTGTGILSAYFDLYDQTLGVWDVVVLNNNAEMSLPGSFTINQGVAPDTWVSILGRGLVLTNMWQTYTISYGNNGNVDAYVIPLWLAFTNYPELEIEFIDFEVVVPDKAEELGIADEIKNIGLFFETDSILGQAMDAKVYPLLIPVIPANSTTNIHIRVKSPGNMTIKTWMNPPWAEYVADSEEQKSALLTKSEIKLKIAECITGVLAEGIVDIGTSAIPGVGCLWSIGKQVYGNAKAPPQDSKSVFWSLFSYGVTIVDCGINLSGVGAVAQGIGVFLANIGGYAKSMHDCNQIGKDISGQSKGINVVSSFDPNEIIGPSGFGVKNYIIKNNLMP